MEGKIENVKLKKNSLFNIFFKDYDTIREIS
jgi:hypothetical protein